MMRTSSPNPTSVDGIHHLIDGIRIVDIGIMAGCGCASYAARYAPEPLSEIARMLLAFGVLLFAFIANSCGLYDPQRLARFKRQMVPLATAHACTLIGLVTLMFFIHIAGHFSRIWIGLWFGGAFATMAFLRLGLMHWLTPRLAHGVLARRIILVGGTEKTQQVIASLCRDAHMFSIIGVCITDAQAPTDAFFDTAPRVAPIPIIASISALAERCRSSAIDDVIITSDLEHHPDAAAIIASLEALPCSVKYCMPGHFFGRPLTDAGLLGDSAIVTLPVVTVFRKPLSARQHLAKRATDIILSSLALILFAPAMGVVALLIAREKNGPIFFRQPRHGFGGHEFSILKFRSMKAADTPETELQQATKNDPRITKLGRFIRKTSIDELPQLINVLRGDMSLVGPRPHALSHNHYYETMIDSYAARHRIKPGITGLAQVNGWRGQTETVEKMRRRVEHDLYYIEHWSLWLDLKILLLTMFTMLRDKNAY